MAEMSKKSKLTAYALFSGGGGMHLGLQDAGFKICVATDHSNHAENTHLLNLPEIPFIREDVRKLSSKALLEAAGGEKPDLIAGGPPCQGFSTLGNKLSSDPRNNLFEEFARLVSELAPKYVLMENVKSLTTMYQGRFKQHILDTFEALGYRMEWKILDAADYGVPQFRKRVFFFGTKKTTEFSFPRPTHGPDGKKPYETTQDAIMDLVKKGDEFPNHIALKHTDRVVARYKFIPEGGRLPPPEELPASIRRKNFGNTYKRLDRKMPSLTMVPGNNAFPIHPTLNRSLTPREAARLQTFPDEYIFTGDRRSQCISVGNAVPPKLAECLGEAIIKHHHSTVKSVSNVVKIQKLTASSKNLQSKKSKMSQSFIDLFCGAGGFTIGLQKAGWNGEASIDLNKYVSETHTLNFPEVPYLQSDLSKSETIDELEALLGETKLGLLAGGPPCQGFSIFGKRRFVNTKGYKPADDPRNKLVYSYIEAVRRLQPRWFIMENVPGLANLDKGLFLENIVEELKSCGYDQCEYRILNAADYGVPQLRRRLIIMGNRTGHVVPWPKKKYFADPKDWQDAYRTVGEVITDLSTEASLSKFNNHVPMKHKPLLVERYKYIPEGGKLDVASLPVHLQSGYRTKKVKNYSHVYKRLHRDKPANTMVPGHNAFPIHPWLNRALTVREAARIQSFPDDLEFVGPRQEQCIQAGNAFPPLLAEVIGNNIRKAEVNNWTLGNVPKSAYYALLDRNEEEDEVLAEKLLGIEDVARRAAK